MSWPIAPIRLPPSAASSRSIASSTRRGRAGHPRAAIRRGHSRAGDIERGTARCSPRKDDVRVLEVGDLRARRSRSSSNSRALPAGCWCRRATSPRFPRRIFAWSRSASPPTAELEDLLFAWRVAKFVKSNAIVCAKDKATVGIGAGQMSRVVSTQNRRFKGTGRGVVAGSGLGGLRCVLSVPRRSGRARRARHRSVIQPGGSKRDAEVIAAADEHGMAMVFTDTRHFRH